VEISHTKKSTRIIIWVIAIVMAVGSLGAYFLVILENENAKKAQTQQLEANSNQPEEELPVDPTAYKVNGKVEKLETTDHKVGDGAEAKVGDTIKVHYKGTLATTGQKFDSSYDRGEPIDLPLQLPNETQRGVIEGWVEGIKGMKVGGTRRLVIPAAMAYGPQAQPGIPANSDLVFEVELLGVTPAGQ
jgi:FKBP-type peptidyl-prolyl cis-trans isomerase FkpA